MDDNTTTLLIALVNGLAALLVAWLNSQRKKQRRVEKKHDTS